MLIKFVFGNEHFINHICSVLIINKVYVTIHFSISALSYSTARWHFGISGGGLIAHRTVNNCTPFKNLYSPDPFYVGKFFLPLQYSQKRLQPTLGSLRSICQLSFPLTSCCKSVNHRNCSGAHGTAGPFFSEPPR